MKIRLHPCGELIAGIVLLLGIFLSNAVEIAERNRRHEYYLLRKLSGMVIKKIGRS